MAILGGQGLKELWESRRGAEAPGPGARRVLGSTELPRDTRKAAVPAPWAQVWDFWPQDIRGDIPVAQSSCWHGLAGGGGLPAVVAWVSCPQGRSPALRVSLPWRPEVALSCTAGVSPGDGASRGASSHGLRVKGQRVCATQTACRREPSLADPRACCSFSLAVLGRNAQIY